MTEVSDYTYNIVGGDGGTTNVTVFVPGETPYVADDSHANYDAIIQAIVNKETVDFESLFDIGRGISKRFLHITDRVSVRDGKLYFDLEEIDNSLTQQIVRFLDEDEEDWVPLVLFLENVADNPQEHSRNQLYNWLEKHKFTITSEGYIVGYKGVNVGERWYVNVSDDTKQFVRDEYPEQANEVGYSTQSGTAIVDGQELVDSYIPYPIGSLVEMPRSEVVHDPATACSYGLHVGTFSFAKHYGQKILEVHVNPRDVVSVPNDSQNQKIRTCRLYVEGVVTDEYETVVKPYVPVGDEEDEFEQAAADAVKGNFVKATDNEINSLASYAKNRKRGFERTAVAQGWEKRWRTVIGPDSNPDDYNKYDWYRPVEWRLPLTV